MKSRVLIIDDDQDFIDDMTLLLENDFQVASTTTVDQVLKLLATVDPDVVLLDLMLGEADNGLEVLSQIKNVDENLPVIMITDYAYITITSCSIQRDF